MESTVLPEKYKVIFPALFNNNLTIGADTFKLQSKSKELSLWILSDLLRNGLTFVSVASGGHRKGDAY